MTIDEAIENRTTYLKNSKMSKSTDDYNATLLSIEALKYAKSSRDWDGVPPYPLLPGETTD